MNRLQVKAAIELVTGKNIEFAAANHFFCHKVTLHRIINAEVGKSDLYDCVAELVAIPKHILWPYKFKSRPDTAKKEGS